MLRTPYTMHSIVRDVFNPERFLYLSVRLSVCLSVCLFLYVCRLDHPLCDGARLLWCAMPYTRAISLSIRPCVCHYMFAMLTTAMWQRSPTLVRDVTYHSGSPYVRSSVCPYVYHSVFCSVDGLLCDRVRLLWHR